MGGREVLWVALAVLAAGSAACGSGGDKAGGRGVPAAVVEPVGKPITLTLAAVDELWASEYAAAVRRLSGGTIAIDVRYGGDALVDYERVLVERVRRGKVDLASVGARAWDRMGVSSFRALVAPLAIDSLALERRVLESPAAAPALDGVRPLGLIGLAVLPGPLRRPLGLTRALRGPDDYAGAMFGVRFGRVAQSSIEALDATPAGYRAGSLDGLDGAELDLATLVRHGYDAPGSRLTANVVLWSRPETIVVSRAAFARLDPRQRAVLVRAGREAIAPVAARVAAEQVAALDAVCNRGTLALVAASAAQLAHLRAAVQPVYDELAREPAARPLLAEIRRLRQPGVARDVVRCPSSTTRASALEGAWEATVSEERMLANGATAAEVSVYGGHGTLELRDGRFTFRTDRAAVTGTYAVAGEDVHLTMRTCTANPCSPGATTDYTWSEYHDTLTLAPRAGLPAWAVLVSAPRTRVG